MKDEWDGKHAQIIVQATEQTQLITSTDSKIIKIMEQANTLMVNDASKMEKITLLEHGLKGLEDKLKDLESADVYLQESCRQATEKTIALEGQSKKAEDNLTSLYKQQQEDIEGKLKVQIRELIKDVADVSKDQNQLLVTVTEQKGDVDKKIVSLEESMKGFTSAMGDSKKEAMEMSERLVSLQFQAEKAQYVEVLTSRIEKMDESRQQSEAKNKEDYENLIKNNAQQLTELLKTIEKLQTEFEAEKNLNKIQCEDLSGQVSVLNENNEEHGKALSTLEPFTKTINNKVTDLEKQIQEKIKMIFSQTEEHRQLIEKSSSSISVFSEKILSYEKDQHNLTEQLENKTSEELNKLREQLEKRVLGTENSLEIQEAKLLSLEARIEGTSGQAERMLEDLVHHGSELNDMRQTLAKETDLVVKRVAEQQNNLSTLEERFERMETAQIYESKQFELIKEITDSNNDHLGKLEERMDYMEDFGKQQNSLILAVEKTLNDKFDEVDTEFRENTKLNQQEFRNIRGEGRKSTQALRNWAGQVWFGT